MKLQAIIGARKGKANRWKLLANLIDEKIIFESLTLYNTNRKKLKHIDNELEHRDGYCEDGCNVYLCILNLQDPQEFYRSLLKKPFTLIDSKLIREKDYKTKC